LEAIGILRDSEYTFFVDNSLYGGAIRAFMNDGGRSRRICPLIAFLYLAKKKFFYWRAVPISELARELGFSTDITDALLLASDWRNRPLRSQLERTLNIGETTLKHR
jgi:hypothetical protein